MLHARGRLFSSVSFCFLFPFSSAATAQVGTVDSKQKISATTGGFGGDLDPFDVFGGSVAALGDLDGDGVSDLAASASGNNGDGSGAVWVLFMESDGTVKTEQKITTGAGGFTGTLEPFDGFGGGMGSLGDLDGDGVTDLAVGASGDDDGGSGTGALWILFLNADGTVKAHQKISATEGGFGGTLGFHTSFGVSVAPIGDLDGDGVVELAVGQPGANSDRGAIWILFLNADGTVASERKVGAGGAGGFGGVLNLNDRFGSAVSPVGDLNEDGIPELAVGANGDHDTFVGAGAAWILFLNADGTVAEEQKIVSGAWGTLEGGDTFGSGLAPLGDLDVDGVPDLAVGSSGDDDGGFRQGAVWILFLNADGTVKDAQEISEIAGGFGAGLDPNDALGVGVETLGDFDGDGVVDLAVGAPGDDDGGSDQGAIWLLNLEGPPCFTLDFETEDDFATPLVNGQHIDVEFGALVSLASSGPNAGLAIFDSTPGGPNDPSQDRDLLVDTGNVLILQTENYPPDGNDVFPRPNDDEDGGTIRFHFGLASAPHSVRLTDIDAGDGTSTVVLTDAAGKRRTYTVPSNWTGDLLQAQPGQGTLDLTTLAPQPGFASTATATEEAGFDEVAVVRLDVDLHGSGALDDLDFCAPNLPLAGVAGRNGSGLNPHLLSASSEPDLGEPWVVDLDCRGYSGGLAVLTVRGASSQGTFSPFGEVLVGGTLLHRALIPVPDLASSSSWTLDVPFDLTLCGRELHVQGLCQESASVVRSKLRRAGGQLSNALDIVLGF